jgi:hypothetical protein
MNITEYKEYIETKSLEELIEIKGSIDINQNSKQHQLLLERIGNLGGNEKYEDKVLKISKFKMKLNKKVLRIFIFWFAGCVVVVLFALFSKLTGLGRLFEYIGPTYTFKEILQDFIANPVKSITFILVVGGLMGYFFYYGSLAYKNKSEEKESS